MNNQQLSNNTLALIALCNEYRQSAEQARDLSRDGFIDAVLRLLPRIYIAVTDVPQSPDGSEMFMQDALDEDYYDSVRRGIESVMGEDDTYLDVFEEDMKYSDTPISASIAEGCADLFQVFYNYLETVREAPNELIEEATLTLREDFAQYWARTLCNVLRAVNAVRYR
ncbi:MAG: DUF5063 domain-containing protein [Muribaculaceae bacterium]